MSFLGHIENWKDQKVPWQIFNWAISPRLRYITSGLLQQSTRRSSILSYCTTSTYPEHSCKAHHPHQEIRAHHTSNSVSSLAPDPSTHHLLFVYKIKHDLAPSYLKAVVSFRSSSSSSTTRRLRSASIAHLQLSPGPRTRTRYGDRAFSVIAPTIWNNLPTHIRDAPSLDSFKSLLKTHLFIQS